MQAAAFVDMSVAGAAGMALKIRNFFVLPLLLVWATGTSITGEIRGQTLREDLVRPVSRGLVLSSKMVALGGLSAVTLMASYVPSVLGGIVFFGLGDDGQFGTFGLVSLGYLAWWASDMGLIAITVALGLFVRTVGGLVVSLVMILMADLAARLMLDLGSAIFQAPTAGQFADFLPGAALAAWEGWRSGWEVAPFVGLVLWTSLALCTAFWRFSRADVA